MMSSCTLVSHCYCCSIHNSLPDSEPRCGAGVALGLSELLQLTPRPENTSMNDNGNECENMGTEKRQNGNGQMRGG